MIKLLTALVCVNVHPIFKVQGSRFLYLSHNKFKFNFNKFKFNKYNIQCRDHVNSYTDIGMGMFTYPIEIP